MLSENQPPVISVIVAVYNRETLLDRCVESLVYQTTEAAYEIILIDDCSTDSSWDIMQSWCDAFPGKIRIFRNTNKGVAHTKNLGIAKARGEYLTFVDSDDYVSYTAFDDLLKARGDANPDIVLSPIWRVSNGRKTGICVVKAGEDPREAFLKGGYFFLVGKLLRRDLFQRYGKLPDLSISEDVSWMFPALTKAGVVTYTDSKTYYYEYSSNSISTSTDNEAGLVHDAIAANRLILRDSLPTYRDLARNYVMRRTVGYLARRFASGRESIIREIKRIIGELPKDEGDIKLSIVVPFYNVEKYIGVCLDSIIRHKDCFGIEIICVDDGSTDLSIFHALHRQFLDHRIRIIRQDNQGPGVARNAGMKEARGDYIAFLDADDRFTLGTALDDALEQAIAGDLDILICGSYQMAEDGTILRQAYLDERLAPRMRVFSAEELGDNIYRLTPQNPWSKLYRRQFLIDNEISFPALKRAEDFAFVQLASSLASRIGIMSNQLVCHRIGVGTSCESTKDETPLLFLEGERVFREFMERRGLWKRFERAASISSIRRLAYNLGAVRDLESFIAIAREADAIYWSLKKNLGDVVPPEIEGEAGIVEQVLANIKDERQLIGCFIKIREAKMVDKGRFDMVSRKMLLQHADLRKKLTASWASIRELRNSLAKTRADRDAKSLQVQEFRASLEKTRADRDAKSLQVQELRDSLAKARSERDEKSRQAQELRDSLAKTRSDRDAKSQQVQELRDSLAKTRSDRDAKSRQVQEFRVACKSARETVIQVRGQRDELAAKLREITKVVV